MPKLARRILTNYAMYFNRRYNRVGHLFQGVYKAAIILEDSYLLHLSRYIPLNPDELTGSDPVNYPYSSYPYYLGEKKADWLRPEFILSFFKKSQDSDIKSFRSYKEFVEDFREDPKEILGHLVLEAD